MVGREFLQTSHTTEAEYSPFSSSKRQVSTLCCNDEQRSTKDNSMSRSVLYIVIGVVIVAAIGGYLYNQDRRSSVAIEIDGNGVTIDQN